MSAERIKHIVSRILSFLVVLNLIIFNTPILGVSAYAASNDIISFDGSNYSKEVENLQSCLNMLGYRDSDNMILGVDGCFGSHTKSALDKFLKDQGFDKYNNKAKAMLYSLAENAFNNRLNSNSSPNSQTYDAIAFDGSSYSYEVENLQYCLNMLGYTGLDNRMLDIDGYFGDNTKCALYKFLNAQGFDKYNNETRNKLISLGRNAFSNRLNQDSASTSDSSPYAAPSDMITFDGSSYNGEVAYLQYCLNKLGYTDSDNSTLDTDGIMGSHTKSALNKYIKTQGFAYLNNEAITNLMSMAENTEDQKVDLGFTPGVNKLTPTAFLYSSPSNINNSDDPFYSMSVLKELPYIITMRPTEMSYKSYKVTEAIKNQTKLFGYVNLGPNNPTDDKSRWRIADLNNLKSEIDSIAKAGWYGVFIDQFGYDWGETRERQTTIVDYIHSKGLHCMVNSWSPEDAFDSKADVRANPNGTPSHLGSGDWYLIESFLTDGDSYRGDSSYIEKYIKIKQYKESTGVNVSVLSYKRDSIDWQQASDDVKMSYILAQCLGFDGWWFGKTDNEDCLLYGKEPNIDIGNSFTKPFGLESGSIYTAETEKYRIEYSAQDTPELKLIPKNI